LRKSESISPIRLNQHGENPKSRGNPAQQGHDNYEYHPRHRGFPVLISKHHAVKRSTHSHRRLRCRHGAHFYQALNCLRLGQRHQSTTNPWTHCCPSAPKGKPTLNRAVGLQWNPEATLTQVRRRKPNETGLGQLAIVMADSINTRTRVGDSREHMPVCFRLPHAPLWLLVKINPGQGARPV
jgi:hypothetical protein